MNRCVAFRIASRLFLVLTACGMALPPAAPAAEIVVDWAQPAGEFRAVHGANFGPLCANGTVDLTPFHRALALPVTRLHDIPWTYGEVVDIHTLFPDFRADPTDPASYDFRRTDDYLRGVTNTGARIVFRLGESIEHTPVKYWVHPPPDFAKWAEICAGVVRHCNEGWAGGLRLGIRDWEVWNEPENQPACWTGSDGDYFRLYEVTARTLKSLWPELRVGGPAVGNTGRLVNGTLEPSRFLTHFLAFCRARALPLDFFSWHCYADDPDEFVARARAIRTLLDSQGYTNTPSHLNEWNYLPRGDWAPMLPAGQGESRERMFAAIGGAEGAAFAAAALLRLQDAPVEMANYFSADNQGFGLFTPAGAPRLNYHAFLAFRELLDMPVRVAVQGDGEAGLTPAAGRSRAGEELRVLISRRAPANAELTLRFTNLPWAGFSGEAVWLDSGSAPRTTTIASRGPTLTLPPCGPGVVFLKLRAP